MSTAVTADYRDALPAAAEAGDDRNVALPLRADTFLGVFEAIGQDLGINPNWLRIPCSALILWNPVVVIASYFGLGAVVALSRKLYPAETRESAGDSVAADADAGAAVAPVENRESEERLAA